MRVFGGPLKRWERFVLRGQPGAQDHEKQRDDKQNSGNLTENQKRQENAYKRGNRRAVHAVFQGISDDDV